MNNLIRTRSEVITDIRSLPILTMVNVGSAREPMTFERKIAWLAECEANYEFVHGQSVLKNGTTVIDHTYGFGSCLSAAIEYAKEAAEAYQVTPESTLEIVVRARVTQTAVLYDTRTAERSLTTFEYVPSDWLVNDPDTLDNIRRRRRGEDVEVTYISRMKEDNISSTVIWSSLNSESDNEALLRGFKAQADRLRESSIAAA